MCCRNAKLGAFLCFGCLLFQCLEHEARAERRQIFSRRPSSVNRGTVANGRLLIGTGQQIPGFASLVKIARNEFLIGADGRLGVREQRSDGTQQDLFLGRDGRVFGSAGRVPESRTLADLSQFLSGGRSKSNRPGRVDQFVGRQTGNRNGVNGLMAIDLSSILPLGDEMKAGTKEQLDYALATLNQVLNSLSNSGRIIRIFPKDLRRDASGKVSVTINLSNIFNRNALSIMAASDPTFRCTGKLRLQTLTAAALDAGNYYRIKGIEGFNRDQIYNALGVEGDPKRTLNNKILIAGNPGETESGVTTSSIGRVSKFMNQRRIPGATCYETDDFIDRSAPGGQTNGRDVKQVGILYTPDAREVLCQQRNGYMLGMLFNAAGTLVTEAPANIALDNGRGIVGPAVSATISCMGCHAKGFLGGGRKIDRGLDTFYKDNFNSIPATTTAFTNQFGQQVRHRDFFTTNQRYRERANVDTQSFFRALARSGGLIVGADGYPMPVVPLAVQRYNSPLKPVDMARELGVSETTLTSILGPKMPAVANRKDFDNVFCDLKRQAGSNGGALGFSSDRGDASLVRGGGASRIHSDVK